ncbi:FkbM family methyltransferase [Microbulbifer elongatus]|uniref:FkbM family methyltransferase n=1 Tax=Microbulbifer elongatus TaxID=86173 RepID=UPI001CFC828C|nr:FkbM family methyltransferase [Microbulbifer elongatus]
MNEKIMKRSKKIIESIKSEGLLGYLKRLHDLGMYRHAMKKIAYANRLNSSEALVHGHILSLPERTAGIKEELLLYGVHEPLSTKLYQQHLQEGDIIFDVGTNLGYYITVANTALSGNCKIFGFEPDPELYELAKQNGAKLASPVTMTHAAASDSDKALQFYRSEVSNWGTIVPRECLQLSEKVNVSGVRVDSFAKKTGIEPTVLRMDIEGGELLALRGSKEILKSVRLIFIELHCVFLERHELEEIFSILAEAGFESANWVDRYYDWPWSTTEAQDRSRKEGTLKDLKEFSIAKEYGVLGAFIFNKKAS